MVHGMVHPTPLSSIGLTSYASTKILSTLPIDKIKLTMLQNAVQDSPELVSVKDTATQLAVSGGHALTYESYKNLLLSKCQTLDSTRTPHTARRSTRPSKRTVYSTDVASDVGEDEYDTPIFDSFDSDEIFDIDSDPATLIANAHIRRANAHMLREAYRTRMSGTAWHKLSSTGQGIWDKLSDEDKEVILDWKSFDSRPRKPNLKTNTEKPRTNKVNLHDISAHDYIQAFQASTTTEDTESTHGDGEEAPGDSSLDQEQSQLLAFLTSRGEAASPADLRNVLSSTSKKKPAKKPSKR